MNSDALQTRSKEFDSFEKTKEFKLLNKPNLFKSLGQIVLEYVGVACCIFICLKFWSIPLYIISTLYIVSRKHALGVILHDGVHYRICKNKNINDLVTDLFITYPLISSLYNARNIHFQHHQNPNTIDDPDWIVKQNEEWYFPQKPFTFLYNLFKYAFGIHVLLNFFKRKPFISKIEYFLRSFTFYFIVNRGIKRLKLKTYPYNNVIRILYYAVLICLLTYFHIWFYFIIFWIMPSFLWMPFIGKMRTIAEHFGVPEKDNNAYSLTRTMYPTWFDKYFLSASWYITYHVDHHLYPGVPSYNIGKLHSILKLRPEYIKMAHITPNGYYGVFQDCIKLKA